MSPDPTWPYSILGLTAPPETQADIRRAYAKRLKTIDQSKDIAGFTALRHAYEAALALADLHHQPPTPDTAPPPEPPPLTDYDFDPTPPAPQPDPDLHRLTTLLTSYGDGRPLAERIAETLAHPLSHNPDHAPTLRRAIARALTNASQPGSDERSLPVSITQALLLALDHRYGWLSDYTAFAADFPGDTELLDLMATRAFPNLGKPRVVVSEPKRLGPALPDWVSARVIFFGLFILLQISRALLHNSQINIPDAQGTALVFAVLSFGALYLGHSLSGGFPFAHARKISWAWLILTAALLITAAQTETIAPFALPLALLTTAPFWLGLGLWARRKFAR